MSQKTLKLGHFVVLNLQSKLNDHKTEFIVFGTKAAFPVTAGTNAVNASDTVRNLGIMLTLTCLCPFFFQIRNIGQIWLIHYAWDNKNASPNPSVVKTWLQECAVYMALVTIYKQECSTLRMLPRGLFCIYNQEKTLYTLGKKHACPNGQVAGPHALN